MKKLLLILTVMMATLMAHAEDFGYLTFVTTDGAKVSVKASSLTLTISGTTLTAGSQSFTLSNLSKMYFSATDESTGIKAVSIQELSDASEVYDLNGRKVSKDQLKWGVYVIKSKSGTRLCHFGK